MVSPHRQKKIDKRREGDSDAKPTEKEEVSDDDNSERVNSES